MGNRPQCYQHSAGRPPDQRPTANRRGYNYQWQRAREDYLARHAVCVACQAIGVTTLASEVDHIRPHRGNAKLFWNRDNWQALCKSCHSAKTQRERREP